MNSIKVRVERDRMGNIKGRPVSERWAKRFEDVVRDNGGGNVDGFFLQEGDAADEFLRDLPRRRAREISKGWPVVVMLDPWYVGHLYGYDAHTVAE